MIFAEWKFIKNLFITKGLLVYIRKSSFSGYIYFIRLLLLFLETL